MKYRKHVFVCNNERTDGSRPSCGGEHGMHLIELFREKLNQDGPVRDIRIQKSGCLDICERGPTVVVYPEGIFYGNVQPDDVEEIVNEHLKNNRPVDRLNLKL